MTNPTRVRFAPSPTGYLHLGGIRSALFNYLLARHTGGTFILRFEDTDRERFVQDAADSISGSLDWLDINPDEGMMPDGTQKGAYGPYVQSERLDIYREYADKLVGSGDMYPCWCTPERLDTLRKSAQAAGTAFKYDRHCLSQPKTMDEPHVLRFKVPERPETIAWHDVVKGPVSFETKDLDDFVALKSDGYPTYNFAVVVDDHLMEISHVLRGDEFVPTTPKNLLVYRAFGWEPPAFVHLPQVLGTDKAKLSKRHGAKPALEYKADGYLPEAVVNFLSALGWNNGTTQEIFSREELIREFTVERIQKSPAVFDAERLTWINGLYLRQMTAEDLLERCEGFWPQEAATYTREYKLAVLGLVQERLKFLAELADLTGFFFSEPDGSLEAVKGFSAEEAREHLQALCSVLQDTPWILEDLESALRGYVAEKKLSAGKLFGLVRVAMTGRTAAPGLFETMDVLGKDTVIGRLKRAA